MPRSLAASPASCTNPAPTHRPDRSRAPTGLSPKPTPTSRTPRLTAAIRALARVLTNSAAFRDLHTNSQSDTIDPACCPLDAPTTEGLFAVLYFLSEQAEVLGQLPIPTTIHSNDAPY